MSGRGQVGAPPRLRAVVTALALLATAPAARARAETYFVGPKGCSDAGPGTRRAAPWCSLTAAAARLGAGDTLRVLDGTYNEQVRVTSSGTAAAPVMIEAAAGESPVVDGNGLSFTEQGLIHVDRQAHLTVRGLTVTASPYYCVSVSASHHVVMDSLVVKGCKHGGIVFDSGSHHVKALRNDVSGTDRCGESCGLHEAITLSRVTDFEVAHNRVHHGIKEGIDAKDGSARGAIHHNVVADMGQVGIYLNHAIGVKVHDNQVREIGSSCIAITAGDRASGLPRTSGNELYRNEVWNCKWNGLEFWWTAHGDLDNNKIYNNVFYATGANGLLLENTRNNIIVNNIFALNKLSGIGGTSVARNAVSHNLFFGNQTPGAVGEVVVTGDPLFVDPAAADFRIRRESPALDRGYFMGLPTVGRADIGAHEFGTAPGEEHSLSGCSARGSPGALSPGAAALVLLVLLAAVRRVPARRR